MVGKPGRSLKRRLGHRASVAPTQTSSFVPSNLLFDTLFILSKKNFNSHMKVIMPTNLDLAPTMYFLSPSTVYLKVPHLVGKLPKKGQGTRKEGPNRGCDLGILAKNPHNRQASSSPQGLSPLLPMKYTCFPTAQGSSLASE